MRAVATAAAAALALCTSCGSAFVSTNPHVAVDARQPLARWRRVVTMTSPTDNVSERPVDIKVGPLKRECLPLSSGVTMEVISQLPSRRSDPRAKNLPPLLFIHGSYHAAWCWAEHWMPFLAGKGYQTYAISLRGTSSTPAPPPAEGQPPVKAIKAGEHVADLRALMDAVLPGKRPVVIAHSFGGLYVMELLASYADPRTALAGVALFCSVPPYGNGPVASRFIREKPIAAIKVLVGFVLKLAVQWPWLARDLFFCKALPAEDLSRYMKHFKADSQVGLDLKDLAPILPSKSADESGRAPYASKLPPTLVAGAENDFIVDQRGVIDTAHFLGVEPLIVPMVPHDVMLGPQYVLGVSRLLTWLESQDFRKPPPATTR